MGGKDLTTVEITVDVGSLRSAFEHMATCEQCSSELRDALDSGEGFLDPSECLRLVRMAAKCAPPTH